MILNHNSLTESSDLNLGLFMFNPIAPRKAKIVYNFGLSECNRVKAVFSVCGFTSFSQGGALCCSIHFYHILGKSHKSFIFTDCKVSRNKTCKMLSVRKKTFDYGRFMLLYIFNV